MTRLEAIKICIPVWGNAAPEIVDALTKLGALHLESTEDKVRIAAIERLTNAMCQAERAPLANVARITAVGAAEIIDVLTKSGFRITRDET